MERVGETDGHIFLFFFCKLIDLEGLD